MNERSKPIEFYNRYINGEEITFLPPILTDFTGLTKLPSAIYLCEMFRLSRLDKKEAIKEADFIKEMMKLHKKIKSVNARIYSLMCALHDPNLRDKYSDFSNTEPVKILSDFLGINKFIYLDRDDFKRICESIVPENIENVRDNVLFEFYKQATSLHSIYGAMYMRHTDPQANIDYSKLLKIFKHLNAGNEVIQNLSRDQFTLQFLSLSSATTINSTLCTLETNGGAIFQEVLNSTLVKKFQSIQRS